MSELETWKKAFEELKPKQEYLSRSPNRDYCPYCGRGHQSFYPVYPTYPGWPRVTQRSITTTGGA